MDQEHLTDTQGLEAGGTDDAASAGGGLEATRGIDLGGLLGGLFGGQGGTEGGGLGGLLGALMGGGGAVDLSTIAPETGLSTSALQAIVPLILGALTGQSHGGGDAGATRTALTDLAEGKAGAADALAGTGLLQQIMHLTGLNQKGALGVILAVLKALGMGKTAAAKPKPKPRPAAKPKPKPKPSASAASKPKPKPKPSTTAAKPKPKPRPASHTTTSKPKPKPKPKRSGEIDLGDSGTEEPGA